MEFFINKPVSLVGKQSRQNMLKWCYICSKEWSGLVEAFACALRNMVMELGFKLNRKCLGLKTSLNEWGVGI